MVQVAFEGATSGCCQAVHCLRNSAVKRFGARDVPCLFQFACVNAQIAVRRFQKSLQVVEAQKIIDGERAEDRQPDAFVDQSVHGQLE